MANPERLRPTQLDTLRLAACYPDGLIMASDIAHHFGRSIRASEQRLERLVASGHLRPTIDVPNGRPLIPSAFPWLFGLTARGRAVVASLDREDEG